MDSVVLKDTEWATLWGFIMSMVLEREEEVREDLEVREVLTKVRFQLPYLRDLKWFKEDLEE